MPLLHPNQRKSFTINKTEATYLAARVANGEKLRFQSVANRNWVNKIAKQRYGITTNVYVAKDQLLDPRYTVEGQDLPDRGLGNDKHYMTVYCTERDFAPKQQMVAPQATSTGTTTVGIRSATSGKDASRVTSKIRAPAAELTINRG